MNKLNTLFLFTCLNLGYCQNVQAAFIKVGKIGDSACAYTSIQTAINNAQTGDTLLISSGTQNNRITYNEDLFITNKSLSLYSGYESCSSTSVFFGAQKLYLQGTGNGAVITIQNSSVADYVYIQQFEITGGNSDFGGGMKILASGLRMFNSIVHTNSASFYGGGIYAADSDLFFRDTAIIANSANKRGGGIYCVNTDVIADSIKDNDGVSDLGVGVSYNSVTDSDGDGGGFYLQSCNLSFYAGIDLDNNPTISIEQYTGISNNSAANDGGGIYAIDSQIYLAGSKYFNGVNNANYGRYNSPVNLDNNIADSDDNGTGNGGGVFLIGQTPNSASLRVHHGLVKSNIANKGGAFYLGGNLSFTMEKNDFYSSSDLDSCWSEQCSVLKNNMAKQSGGAIYVTGGIENTRIEGTQIFGNRANEGSVISIDSSNAVSNLDFFNNTIYHNGRDGTGGFTDNSVFDLYNNSSIFSDDNLTINMAYNTIVDNHVTVAAFIIDGIQNYLKIYSSILHDPSSNQIGQFNGGFNEVIFDCVNVNETTSIDMSYSTLTRMNADNPGFFMPNYDYHLKDTSAMIDFCDDSLTTPLVDTFNIDFVLEKDRDNNTRAVDINSINDFYGAYDLGSDENIGNYNSDIIFIDGFDW